LTASDKHDAGAGDGQHQPQKSGRQAVFHVMLHWKSVSIRCTCNKPNAGVNYAE
jgi:hypothetical protein